VVCLLSALQFHQPGTQWPHEIWIALDRGTRRPQLEAPRLRVFRFSGDAFSTGIETHVLEGVPVRVYGASKTVADCFKFRHRIGLDVAIEALQAYIRRRPDTLDALWHAAQACRVANVMRPYAEASL
jgi:predicted transcriptional regulator of viral defense system